MHDHERTRAWLSALRDGEARDEPSAWDEVAACADCRAWAGALDEVEASAVRAAAEPGPDVAGAALSAWRCEQRAPASRGHARLVLGLAGVSGIVLAALSLLALPAGSAAGHLGRDLLGFQAVYAVGFLLCSADPGRYARALLPLTAVASVVVLLPSAAAGATGVGLLAEASHLPVLLGLVGLLLLLDTHPRPRRPRPTLA